MPPVDELIQLAQLVRATADKVNSAMQKRLETGSDRELDLQTVQKAKVELGVAFQSLVRAAHALDLVRAP